MQLDDQYRLWALERSEQTLSNLLEEIRQLAIRAVRSRCDYMAEDLGQQIAISCWQALDKYNSDKASISTWVGMIADSILNRQLVTTYREMLRDDIDIATLEPESEDLPDVDSRLIHGFDADLELLNLLLQGHSLSECARQLGITRMTARTRLQAAKARTVEINITTATKKQFVM
jgi:RNA polymerase sigma factor (sigma-70 family)